MLETLFLMFYLVVSTDAPPGAKQILLEYSALNIQTRMTCTRKTETQWDFEISDEDFKKSTVTVASNALELSGIFMQKPFKKTIRYDYKKLFPENFTVTKKRVASGVIYEFYENKDSAPAVSRAIGSFLVSWK